jgi:hypothetical protein
MTPQPMFFQFQGNWSPLMLAVTKSVPFVELLLKAGADINAPNQVFYLYFSPSISFAVTRVSMHL